MPDELMEKTGEVRPGTTPCDLCSCPAVKIFQGMARCGKHSLAEHEKAGSCVVSSLKSFTQPLDSNEGLIKE